MVKVMSLTRREILEQLVRQGIMGLSRIKHECRCFELYWALCRENTLPMN